MKSNSELRNEAKATMSGNWGSGILIAVVSGLILSAVASLQVAVEEGSASGSLIYSLLYIFVAIPITYGVYFTFLRFCRGAELNVGNIFGMFNSTYYLKCVVLGLLVNIYTFLWTLLLIVPGVIKSLSYYLAPYILIDNPELTAEQAICRSMDMMRGHKMDLFLMMLGYVGFTILSAFFLFVPLLWLVPFYQTVFAKFYENIRAEYVYVEYEK